MEAETSIAWTILYDYVWPTVLSIGSLALVAVVPAAGQAYFKWLEGKGIKVDKDRQEVFQKGMETVAATAIAKAGGGPLTKTAIEAGVAYARESLPKSIAAYDLDDRQLAEKVVAKATLLALQAPAAVAEVVAPPVPAAPIVAPRRLSGRAAV